MDRRDRQNIAVAVVALFLIVATYWMISGIRRQGLLEDCLMQGRRNCDRLVR